jgi:uncharacterized protein (DUF1697 family)
VRTWVALLRAVNLGAYNKVSMPALREALAEAGFGDVRTYVQSGNVVLRSDHAAADDVAAAVRKVIAGRFDVDTPVVVRTGAQLKRVLDWNPFPEAAEARPNRTVVVHLAGKPEPAAVREVLAVDVAPDAIAVRGLEIVVGYAGTTQSKPTAAALKKIGVDGTSRNWRTLSALVELATQVEAGKAAGAGLTGEKPR